MKVWILRCGCKFEGGGAPIAVFASEEAGLKAAEEYMQKEIAYTEERNQYLDDKSKEEGYYTKTYFTKDRIENDVHVWTEHSVHGSQVLGEQDYDHDFLELIPYQVHG